MPSLGAICLLQSVPKIQIVSQKNSGGFDIDLILEGDLKKPSLGAICLLQSVPQIHFFKFRELSNLILEGDVEKPSLGAICLLQSVPQIDSFL